MMEFKKIELEQEKEWETIREDFADGDVYYMNGYVKGLSVHGDGAPILVYYEENGLRLMNVLMKRDLSEFGPLRSLCPPGTWYDATTPYGYGGMLAEGKDAPAEQWKRAAAAYRRFCVKEHIVSEFVRFYPLAENAAYGNWFWITKKRGPTVVLPLRSEEEIWNQMKSTHRNRIRRAEKKGITIKWGTGERELREFQEIYRETMDRDRADSYYYFKPAVYETWFQELKGHITLFWAELEGKTIASSIMLMGKGRLHYHLGGTRTEYLSDSPNNLLFYEAACYGFRNGYREMHLGGGLGSREDSLYLFKKKFCRNGKDPVFFTGTQIYDQERYRTLETARGFRSVPSYFPSYRGMEELE